MYANIISFYILTNFMFSFGNDCLMYLNPIPKIFSTIQDFHRSSHNHYQENYIILRVKNIENLTVDILDASGSNLIIKLELIDNNIQNIGTGAFGPLECLKCLELQNNNISRITARTFSSLTDLTELNLSQNNLKEIPNNAFSINSRLRKLFLSNNKITTLNKYSFYKLPFLKVLDLHYNRLTTISLAPFSFMEDLLSLNLAFNTFTNLEIQTLNLTILEHLDISGNYLESVNFDHKFPFELTLQSLNLSDNNLKQLNAIQLRKAFPHLLALSLDGNPWDCDDLSHVVAILETAGINCTDHGRSIGMKTVRGIDCFQMNETNKIEEMDVPFEWTTLAVCFGICLIILFFSYILSRVIKTYKLHRKLYNYLRAVRNENERVENQEDNLVDNLNQSLELEQF